MVRSRYLALVFMLFQRYKVRWFFLRGNDSVSRTFVRDHRIVDAWVSSQSVHTVWSMVGHQSQMDRTASPTMTTKGPFPTALAWRICLQVHGMLYEWSGDLSCCFVHTQRPFFLFLWSYTRFKIWISGFDWTFDLPVNQNVRSIWELPLQ